VLSDQIIPNGITPINTKNNTVANNMAIDEKIAFLEKIRNEAAIMYTRKFNDSDFPDF
jgi:hypothetical protein